MLEGMLLYTEIYYCLGSCDYYTFLTLFLNKLSVIFLSSKYCSSNLITQINKTESC